MAWKTPVLEMVVERYRATVLDLLATVQQMEKTLKRRGKSGAGKKGGISDADKIGLQLYLDAVALGEELEGHDVDLTAAGGYQSLLEEVQQFKAFLQP